MGRKSKTQNLKGGEELDILIWEIIGYSFMGD